jgi:hypothetical protein
MPSVALGSTRNRARYVQQRSCRSSGWQNEAAQWLEAFVVMIDLFF